MTTKEKLVKAITSSEQVRKNIRSAIDALSRPDTHVNGYGALMRPSLCQSALFQARAEINLAIALIDDTAWLSNNEYDEL